MMGEEDEVDGSYQFRTLDGPASTAVVEAVAFVTGLDPLDIEPLGRVVDADALDRLLESADRAAVSFEMEGLAVRVTAGGDIEIESPAMGPPDDAELGRSNLLLLDGPDADSICSNHVESIGSGGTNVLAVTFSPPDAGWLDSWITGPGESSDTAVISVGDSARSAAGSPSVGAASTRGVAVDTVADPADLSALEDRIGERLAAWERTDDRTVVCFDSVTAVLEQVGPERTVAFLESVIDRTRDAAASAHFHLDPERHGGEFEERASTLFDAVVTIEDGGEWVVEATQRG